MRISDWSSDVCSSDLAAARCPPGARPRVPTPLPSCRDTQQRVERREASGPAVPLDNARARRHAQLGGIGRIFEQCRNGVGYGVGVAAGSDLAGLVAPLGGPGRGPHLVYGTSGCTDEVCQFVAFSVGSLLLQN